MESDQAIQAPVIFFISNIRVAAVLDSVQGNPGLLMAPLGAATPML